MCPLKVPVVNSKNQFTGKVIKELNKNKIKLNITAVYTAQQTKKILKNINKKSKVIISIFAGRLHQATQEKIRYQNLNQYHLRYFQIINLAKKFKNVRNFMGKCQRTI